ncbi:histidine phosphatase family protein [Comamonas sp. NLF-1-9]|uniref:histidine phosphatase family protein n=1 Tax=Comamonas sp. NLF-1-9 TaxID=2853163 RepID=UPI001C4931E3|nr:histidine phosphatase family protein [Comamonas sp. NLF-1-9]QXL83174.1 histidine phosphatase family protein [Comamonas sp. NLF-1-9]
MKLWLVRHARVALPEGVCYGASEVPADRAHTRAAARALVQAWPPMLAVWHSPLSRCELLALDAQGLRPDLVLKPDARLRELDFGAWEGRPWSAIERAAFDAWLADFSRARPGGTGESVAALMARVAAAFDDWLASGRDAAWVTHAGVVRAASLIARGVRSVARASDWPVQAVPWGEALVIER